MVSNLVSFRNKVVTFEEILMYRKKTLDPNFKGAISSPLFEIVYLNKLNFKTFAFKTLREPLNNNFAVFYFQKNFYLLNAINEKIGILKAAGLVDYWISKDINPSFLHIKPENLGPQKLNLRHLLGCFEVWILGIFLGLIAFFLEMCYNKILQSHN